MSMIATALLAAPASSQAQGTGGTQALGKAAVKRLLCLSTAAQPCPSPTGFSAGATATVQGRALRDSRALVFRGSAGRGDDVSARTRHVRPSHFEATVPADASSGPVDVIGTAGRPIASAAIRILQAPPVAVGGDTTFYADAASKPTLAFDATGPGPVTVRVVRVDDASVVREWEVDAAAGANTVTWSGQAADGPAPSGRYRFQLGGEANRAPTSTDGAAEFTLLDHIFPIRGKHDLGQFATNSFGGGRGHQGQDMFAACGTPVVAARGGQVRFAGYHSAAGNYAVIRSKRTGLDYVYMHMQAPALVSTGERVATGQALGQIGDTGRASGCHLHLELWSEPGWYAGGAPFDPLPRLRAWDAWS